MLIISPHGKERPRSSSRLFLETAVNSRSRDPLNLSRAFSSARWNIARGSPHRFAPVDQLYLSLFRLFFPLPLFRLSFFTRVRPGNYFWYPEWIVPDPFRTLSAPFRLLSLSPLLRSSSSFVSESSRARRDCQFTAIYTRVRTTEPSVLIAENNIRDREIDGTEKLQKPH